VVHGKKIPVVKTNANELALLASIVDSSDDAIITKAPDGTITFWNRGAERLYGYTAQEMIGRSLKLITPPDRPNDIETILERIRKGERVDHYETRRVRKDGSTISVSLTVSPILDKAGALVGISSIARDITERQRSEEAHEHRERELEESQRLAGIGSWEWTIATGTIAW